MRGIRGLLWLALAAGAWAQGDGDTGAWFADVPHDHWAAPSVKGLADCGVLTVTPGALFRGDRAMTRYELAALLDRVAFYDDAARAAAPTLEAPFSDIPHDHWAYSAVQRVAELGVVAGQPDGQFHGEGAVTRYETAVAVARLAKHLKLAVEAPRQSVFADVPDDHWACGALGELHVLGLVEGGPDALYHGDEAQTRYAAAATFWRLVRKVEG